MPFNRVSVTVSDLISAGLIKAPTTASAEYAGGRVKAEIAPDGTFRFGGNRYDSPSVAAGHALSAALNRTTPDRKYLAVNGWNVWRVSDSSGRERLLADIRREFTERRVAS